MSDSTFGLYQLLHDSLTQQDLQEAERIARRILDAEPNNAQICHLLGSMLNDQQGNQDAEALYREAIRLQPNIAEVYNNLGVLLGQEGRLREAEEAFQQALRIASMTEFAAPAVLIDAYTNLGNLFYPREIIGGRGVSACMSIKESASCQCAKRPRGSLREALA